MWIAGGQGRKVSPRRTLKKKWGDLVDYMSAPHRNEALECDVDDWLS